MVTIVSRAVEIARRIGPAKAERVLRVVGDGLELLRAVVLEDVPPAHRKDEMAATDTERKRIVDPERDLQEHDDRDRLDGEKPRPAHHRPASFFSGSPVSRNTVHSSIAAAPSDL
jgi:hypothetical protein